MLSYNKLIRINHINNCSLVQNSCLKEIIIALSFHGYFLKSFTKTGCYTFELLECYYNIQHTHV